MRDLALRQPQTPQSSWSNPASKKKLHDEGTEQGKLAMYQTLVEILKHRLGTIPTAVDTQLRACTLAQLNTLLNPALDAATWDEFTARLLAPAE